MGNAIASFHLASPNLRPPPAPPPICSYLMVITTDDLSRSLLVVEGTSTRILERRHSCSTCVLGRPPGAEGMVPCVFAAGWLSRLSSNSRGAATKASSRDSQLLELPLVVWRLTPSPRVPTRGARVWFVMILAIWLRGVTEKSRSSVGQSKPSMIRGSRVFPAHRTRGVLRKRPILELSAPSCC